MRIDKPAAPRLVSRALFLYFVSAFGSMTSFYLLLSVVPLFATAAGAGRTGAGLTTGALMLATVAAELRDPGTAGPLRLSAVLSVGLVLLGAPGFRPYRFGRAGHHTPCVCLVRGIGLAILVVAGARSLRHSFPPSGGARVSGCSAWSWCPGGTSAPARSVARGNA